MFANTDRVLDRNMDAIKSGMVAYGERTSFAYREFGALEDRPHDDPVSDDNSSPGNDERFTPGGYEFTQLTFSEVDAGRDKSPQIGNHFSNKNKAYHNPGFARIFLFSLVKLFLKLPAHHAYLKCHQIP
jgi:hypothetical protein